MKETGSSSNKQITKWKVRDSDAAIIITLVPELFGGSLFTYKYAQKIAKPCLYVHQGNRCRRKLINQFLEINNVQVLNVAGPCSSCAASIEQFEHAILDETLDSLDNGILRQ